MTEDKPRPKPRAKRTPKPAPDKLETPETKVEAPPEEAPRDEEPEQETPESKPAVEVKIDGRQVAKAVLKYTKESERVHEEVAEVVTLPAPESVDLHIAHAPVNAHAPVWYPRTPNTKGGYS